MAKDQTFKILLLHLFALNLSTNSDTFNIKKYTAQKHIEIVEILVSLAYVLR